MGKGGAGKSVIAGTFARLLAARGEPVLAVDSDPMPGMTYSVGVAHTDAGIPDEAVEENTEGEAPRYRLRSGLPPGEAVERYAAVGPDGVRFLQFGKLRGHARALLRSQFAFRQITAQLPTEHWHIVGDLPGGTRQAFLGWGAYARVVVVVAEPTAKSLLTARRLAGLRHLHEPPRVVAVANKVASPNDAADAAARSGLDVVGAVPLDTAVAEAERSGRPVVDVAPEAPAVAAVASLLDRLVAEERVS